MSAPAPGSAPINVPTALPRRICTGYFLVSAHMPLNTLPIGWSTIRSGGLVSTAERMISEIANVPIIIGIMPMPPRSSMLPNVKRGIAAGLFSPTHATRSPSISVTKPMTGRSEVMNTAQVRPSSTSQKYSNELNFNANSASAGAASINTAVPNSPPNAEKTKPAPSAVSAWPFFAIAYASSVYAADAGVPGMRIRQPGISPEKIAIAVAVTMAAIAGIGAMKNVTGTSNAVAIVAVSPGTAPTKSPKSDATTMTKRLYGSNTSAKACAQALLIAIFDQQRDSPCEPLQQTPRQRHPEQLVKAVVNNQGDDQPERKDPARPDPECGEEGRKVDHSRQHEPEHVDETNIEDIDADDERERDNVPRRAHPRLGAYPRGLLDTASARRKATGNQG